MSDFPVGIAEAEYIHKTQNAPSHSVVGRKYYYSLHKHLPLAPLSLFTFILSIMTLKTHLSSFYTEFSWQPLSQERSYE
ncbi:hypothetical protein TUM4444_23360 [Shewanella sp. MBTL60-112-B1]|nr:hypothetical protein TUM4444_23360 [Shewanella sp. MBTL60-112-B1]